MWADPQETADLVTLLEKSIRENFIFFAVSEEEINLFFRWK